jgi:hypothetical protein
MTTNAPTREERMTKAERDEIRARVEKATPGPWIATSDWSNYAVWSQERRRDVVQSPSRVMVNNPLNEWTREGDATFIAASRTDIPKLLDALDAAEERERVLRDALEWYAKRRHYEYDFESGSPVWIDNGSRAREALAATKGES